jgi:DNA-binding transcriptional LysR family regulator
MPSYSLTDFDAVIAISRRGSFRAAALDMGMSTTALSNAIAKLEGQLGVRLFNRTTRSVSLTDAGRRFVDQVTPALKEIYQALDVVRSEQETPSGTLRINAFATAAREIIEPLIIEFLRRFPAVHIDLVTEGNFVDIVAEGFDFGVRSENRVPTDMIKIPLGPSRRYAVCPTAPCSAGSSRMKISFCRSMYAGPSRWTRRLWRARPCSTQWVLVSLWNLMLLRMSRPEGWCVFWKNGRQGSLLYVSTIQVVAIRPLHFRSSSTWHVNLPALRRSTEWLLLGLCLCGAEPRKVLSGCRCSQSASPV